MADDKTLVARLRALAEGLRIERLKPHAVEVDEAADRISALEAERQWRPIETAPKDGSWFLSWGTMHDDGCDMGETPVIRVARWLFEGSCWYSLCSGTHEPTHWLPLPQPPGDGQ